MVRVRGQSLARASLHFDSALHGFPIQTEISIAMSGNQQTG